MYQPTTSEIQGCMTMMESEPLVAEPLVTEQERKKPSTLYVVTSYGCNSTPSEMWSPKNWVFINYDKAYQKYLEIRPDPNDLENQAEILKSEDWEDCFQLPGYHHDYGNFAKRPEGAIIRKIEIEDAQDDVVDAQKGINQMGRWCRWCRIKWYWWKCWYWYN